MMARPVQVSAEGGSSVRRRRWRIPGLSTLRVDAGPRRLHDERHWNAREEALERDRFPVVVHLLAFRQDRLLLLRRANTGFMDGWYAPPGGHQEAGESPAAAIARECREELGVPPLEPAALCALPYRSGRHQGINLVFGCAGFEGEPRICEPVFDLLVWCDLQHLPTPMAPWIATALDLRSSGRWYRELEWD